MPVFGSFVSQEAAPFHLPAAQQTRADGGSNGVTLALYVSENAGTESHPISVQMIEPVARELAVQLLAAADAASKQSSLHP